MIDEDVDFPEEAAALTGCDGANASISDDGDASITFYNWVENEETGELEKEDCEIL